MVAPWVRRPVEINFLDINSTVVLFKILIALSSMVFVLGLSNKPEETMSLEQKPPFSYILQNTDESEASPAYHQTEDYDSGPAVSNKCNNRNSEDSSKWLEYVYNKREDKRSQLCHHRRCLAWTPNYTLIDFGSYFFPRYVQSATDCSRDNGRCSFGTHCRPVPYKVWLLTFRNENDIAHFHHEQHLPESIRGLMKFESKTINATCHCMEIPSADK